MKRILGLAALLGHALGAVTGIQVYGAARGGRGKRPVYGSNAYYSSASPAAKRWWHDLEQPGQCARLQAAKDKRQRRALKLFAEASWSADNNRAHYDEFDNLHDRLNPFYQPPVAE